MTEIREATEREIRASATMFAMATTFCTRRVAQWMLGKRPTKDELFETLLTLNGAVEAFRSVGERDDVEENISSIDCMISLLAEIEEREGVA